MNERRNIFALPQTQLLLSSSIFWGWEVLNFPALSIILKTELMGPLQWTTLQENKGEIRTERWQTLAVRNIIRNPAAGTNQVDNLIQGAIWSGGMADSCLKDQFLFLLKLIVLIEIGKRGHLPHKFGFHCDRQPNLWVFFFCCCSVTIQGGSWSWIFNTVSKTL